MTLARTSTPLVEKALVDRVGPVGEKTAHRRSRNDQVALDVRLYVRDCDRPSGRVHQGHAEGSGRSGGEETRESSCRDTPICSGLSRCFCPTISGLLRDAQTGPSAFCRNLEAGECPSSRECSACRLDLLTLTARLVARETGLLTRFLRTAWMQ